MRRRDFLRLLLASPIAATVDVEQLLWVPKPIVVVPAMPTVLNVVRMTGPRLKKGDVFTIAGMFAVNPGSMSATSVLQQFVVTADVSSAPAAPLVCPVVFDRL